MTRTLVFVSLFSAAFLPSAFSINPPAALISRSGDQSVILHWDPISDPNLAGYRVYRSTNSTGSFSLQTPSLLASPGFADLVGLKNGQTYYYQVTTVTTTSQESSPSATQSAMPHPFASNDEFLDYVQAANFDYFWYLANPSNGLVP